MCQWERIGSKWAVDGGEVRRVLEGLLGGGGVAGGVSQFDGGRPGAQVQSAHSEALSAKQCTTPAASAIATADVSGYVFYG